MIDKNLATELLARELGPDFYVMLTNIDAVHVDLGQADPARHPPRAAIGELGRIDADEAGTTIAADQSRITSA